MEIQCSILYEIQCRYEGRCAHGILEPYESSIPFRCPNYDRILQYSISAKHAARERIRRQEVAMRVAEFQR